MGVVRAFLRIEDLHELVTDVFGARRRPTALTRLTGGTKKGVYRLELDDRTTAIVYVWSADENYWPASSAVSDDPFADASGAALFAANHAALTAVGVRVPRLIALDVDRRYLDVDTAVLEDAGSVRLEDLMARDPVTAAGPLAMLGDALRRMHTTYGDRYGKLVDLDRDAAPQPRRTEDVIVDRAVSDLDEAAQRDARMADARDRVEANVRRLRDAVAPRRTYALVHGELGPDHVLVTPAGEPVMIDIEGLTYFDVEWEHAFLQLRFGAAYPALRPVELDEPRLELCRYAQVLSLIAGPLRIADTDFPDRQWMLDLAERNILKALSVA